MLELSHAVSYKLYEVTALCLTVVPLAIALGICFDVKETGKIFVCMCITTGIKFHLQKIETDP